MKKTKTDITAKRETFKPFSYEFAYSDWLKHEQMHWVHTEVPMLEDVKDFKNKMTDEEKQLLTKVLRFFVQGDIDIGGGYIDHYLPVFKNPEVRMLMAGIVGREALHVAAYAHLIETLGLPETTYNEFLQHQEMIEKHEYLSKIKDMGMLEKIAAISCFGEGMQLFSSFVILLNFARNGKLKGVGQILAWSINDESIHAEAMIKVFRQYALENKTKIWNDQTKKNIYNIAKEMVAIEDNFIDLAFGINQAERLTKEEVKDYIRFIANKRLEAMGMKKIFDIKENPLPWVEAMLGASHTNFFEQKVSDYAKGALSGSWEDVWGKAKK